MIPGIVASARGRVYATWNPLDKGSAATLSSGNLRAVGPIMQGSVRATQGKSSGRWYWEITSPTATLSARPNFGIALASATLVDFIGSDAAGWSFCPADGNTYNAGVGAPFSTGFTATGDFAGLALDMDAGTLELFINGVSQGVMVTGLTGIIFPATGGNASVPAATVANFGASPFLGAVPSGFQAGVFIDP